MLAIEGSGVSATQACLRAVTLAVPAASAALYRIDEGLDAFDYELLGLTPTMHQRYLDTYQRFDPLRPVRCQALGLDLVTLDEARAVQSRSACDTYGRFLARFGVCDVVELLVSDQGRPVLGISLLRIVGQGTFNDRDLDCLAGMRGLLQLALPSLCPPSADAFKRLTSRERELTELLRQGASNKVLAQTLGVGLPTIKTHLNNLYRKLGVHNRTELIATLFLQN
ncbi:helix-turn-helix transcriptional regulator [Pseudomonas sp. KSR10]|jgi:DNA-binding CsgD family transcriptional regulator|uniref:helix-turn-helix transcriptional regulator n=1 Tax=unclassified Pseudomonas TaxID=196821 RepID=UPI001EF7D3AC|nr:helix-turn-helix transcriptional regulator [Pseudomonas sp. KSR10]MCG6541988.1 helix-turn-helix transcriptional regulator [Pseudomonas sp. KSR10]